MLVDKQQTQGGAKHWNSASAINNCFHASYNRNLAVGEKGIHFNISF